MRGQTLVEPIGMPTSPSIICCQLINNNSRFLMMSVSVVRIRGYGLSCPLNEDIDIYDCHSLLWSTIELIFFICFCFEWGIVAYRVVNVSVMLHVENHINSLIVCSQTDTSCSPHLIYITSVVPSFMVWLMPSFDHWYNRCKYM